MEDVWLLLLPDILHLDMLCNEVETARGFTYLGDWVSAGGGCLAAVAARTICG